MNRRSFLGFAVGGAVAAPAAILVGERVEGFPKPSAMPATDVALRQAQQVSVMVTGADGDARIRRLVQEGVQKALSEQRTFAHRKGR
ncbi:hypothetical protein GOE00_02380 [Sinorhizobium medicae]|uniref:hypothetical protein n=1 Tax=Sinorhizobium medicae TaxID=110321 RepID=UPI0012957C24|nr:hypothetical protein [Sinorhizobium medicae]MDX0530746.1 hypothetical protein [Sinorhizobium medicae]MDX0865599.1 hypothetical protein [Sinorhizobium medicae]MDX0889670.1 hypothetical protein [Sinorhizobium medicae]MDX0923900.1 hypothetical protein [Sinorhizobium medicae]MDX0948973.1 hypothetical protein [Sinorhizobium medicae]